MSKEQIQISPIQFTFLFATLIISTADLFIPAFVAQEAKQDSWISAILSSVIMIPILLIYIKLYNNNKGKTLMEICIETTGKIVGRVLGFLYVLYFLYIAVIVVAELSAVLNTAFLPLTPSWAIIIISMLTSAYAVSQGIEVIARVNEILLPAGLGALAFIMLVNIKELDLNLLRPVLKDGIIQPLRGSLVIMGPFTEAIVTLQLIHFIRKSERIKKALFAGLIITGLVILTGTMIYALFGPLTEVFIMPALEFARFAQLGRYIQNLDILIIAIWITGIYIKIMIFYYSGTYALSQLVRLRNYKTIIAPVGFFLCSLTISYQGRIVEILYFIHYIIPVYGLFMALVIPGILLIISIVRKRKEGEEK